MGMTESEFWTITPKYFAMRYRAWQENQHAAWEQARMISFWIVKTVDSKNKFRKFEDLMRLPWEAPEKPKFERVDQAAMQKFSDEADEVLRIVNPAAYEAYMAGKTKQKQAQN